MSSAPAVTVANGDGEGRPAWVQLAAPGAAARRERPLRSWRVAGQVTAAAAVVVTLVCLVGIVAARRMAERESVNDTAQRTNLLAEAVVQPALQDGLLDGDPDALAALDEAVRKRVLDDSVIRVKIWTPTGRIVYSDEPALIGRVYPLGAEDLEVLDDPRTEAEVSDLDKPENAFERGQGKLLEAYRPVWTPQGRPLLFETYSRYDVVTDRAGQLWRGFAGITVSSLLLLVVLLLPVLWTLLDRIRRAQRQREDLLRHAVEASDSERRRIAATLHDGPVQELAAASFALAGASARVRAGGVPDVAPLEEAALAVRGSIQGLRSLLVAIYPPSLATAGLGAALTDLVDSAAGRGPQVQLDLAPGAGEGLDADGEQLVHRVAQECLRNALRHAGARHVRVGLAPVAEGTRLSVDDDGAGFDVADTLANPPEGHFGLQVLRDLAATGDARLQVASAPGRGCRWRLVIPHSAEGAQP